MRYKRFSMIIFFYQRLRKYTFQNGFFSYEIKSWNLLQRNKKKKNRKTIEMGLGKNNA